MDMKFEFSSKQDFLLEGGKNDFCPYCPMKIKCTEHHLLTKHWKWATNLTTGSEGIVNFYAYLQSITNDMLARRMT